MTENKTRPILKLSFNATNLCNSKLKESLKKVSIIEPKFIKFTQQELGNLYKLVRKKFPNTFPPKGEIPKVLAIGIHKELATYLNLSMIKAKSFCRIYCRRKEYIEIRIKGAPRYDLNGTIVGEV